MVVNDLLSKRWSASIPSVPLHGVASDCLLDNEQLIVGRASPWRGFALAVWLAIHLAVGGLDDR